MPPRRKRATPKTAGGGGQIIGKEIVVSAEAQDLIDAMEKDVMDKVQELRKKADIMCQDIRDEFRQKLMKLPRKVREMPLRDFKEQYGSDISAVWVKDWEDRKAASMASMPATGAKTRMTATAAATRTQRRANIPVAETPVNSTGAFGQPGTVLRAPAADEVIYLYTARGSPIGSIPGQQAQQAILQSSMKGGNALPTPAFPPQTASNVHTVVPPSRPGSKTGVPHLVGFTLKDGQQVTVDLGGGLEHLPTEQRQEVQERIDGLAKFAQTFKRSGRTRQ